MKLNFKYYNSGSLIITILVFSILYMVLVDVLSSLIPIPTRYEDKLKLLNEYLGWVSPVAFISLMLFLINNYWWKFRFFRWLIDIPNFNGRYKGELVSSFIGEDGQPVRKDCVLEIKQNASSIHVCSYYADKDSDVQTSMAYSVSEELVKEKNGSFTLFYLFTNEPDSMIEALNKHNGTAKFTYLEDVRELVGEYYNHRLNKGTMKLKYEGSKLLHRFK